MFYHFLYPLREYFFGFNVFQYITFRTGGALLTSLLLVLIFGPFFLRWIKGKKINQVVRLDGPATHFGKSTTPTMGGLLILFSFLISILLWARLDNRFVQLSIFVCVSLGAIGFIDDYLKVFRNSSKGLAARYKLLGQFIIALIVAIYIFYFPPNPEVKDVLTVPFFKNLYIYLGVFYILLAIFIIVGTSNSVNLTDGLDGLAIGLIIIAAGTYAIFSYLSGHAQFSRYLYLVSIPEAGELTVVLGSLVGAGLGFLWFNGYPSQIFMGDTGSLFLGGMIGLTAIIIKQELLLIIVCGVFLIEALSVIIQVFSFRYRGKRVFLMAPLHHHYELKGWPEPKVVVRFWILGIILALIALTTLKVR